MNSGFKVKTQHPCHLFQVLDMIVPSRYVDIFLNLDFVRFDHSPLREVLIGKCVPINNIINKKVQYIMFNNLDYSSCVITPKLNYFFTYPSM